MRGHRGYGAPRGARQMPRFFGYQNHRTDLSNHNLVEAKSETAKLDATLIRLQREVDNLEMERALQLQQDPISEDMFLRWAGISIDESTEQQCRVTFHSDDEHSRVYQIGFHKVGQYWRVSFQNLPYCMTLVPQKVMELKINTIEELGLYVHTVQMDIELFHRRAKQFADAMTISSSTLRIFPAVSTTSVMLELLVDDSNGSNLKKTSVFLTYLREKYLPEEPFFKFKGGDKEAQEEFQKQLACLQYMPLKEALQCAFPMDEQDDELDQNFVNETKSQVSEDGKSPAQPVSGDEFPASQTKELPEPKLPKTSAPKKKMSTSKPTKSSAPKKKQKPGPLSKTSKKKV